MINVGIVEDQPGYQVGLRTIIGSQPDISIRIIARSVEEFEFGRGSELDLVMLDLGLPGGGVEGTGAVKKLVSLGLRVLVVTITDKEIPVLEAIQAGAHGYITKEAEPDEIVRALHTVYDGGTYFSPTVAGYLLRDASHLSSREIEILALIADGERAADIAEQLYISVRTVNGHLESIRDKTGYRNKADLTRLAYEKGILPHRRRDRR